MSENQYDANENYSSEETTQAREDGLVVGRVSRSEQKKLEKEEQKIAARAARQGKKDIKAAEKEDRAAAEESKAVTAEPKKSSGRRGKSEKSIVDPIGRRAELASSNNRREIPTTTYDLLNGAFQIASKGRLVGIAVVAVIGLVLGFTAFRGIATTIETAGLNSSNEQTFADKSQILSQFGTATGLTGVTETQIIERDKILAKDMRDALVKQPDVTRLIDELRRFTNLGVTVTTVAVTRSDLAPKKPNAPAASSTTAGTTPAPKIAPNEVLVTITAQANQFDSIIQWSESVRSVSTLYEPVFTRQGLKVVVTAKLRGDTPGVVAGVLSRFGIPVGVTNTAPVATQPLGTNGATVTTTVPATGQTATPNGTTTTGGTP